MKKRHVFVSLSALFIILAVGLYPKTPSEIVGMAIAKNTGYCYAWYSDGSASFGVSDDLAKHQGLFRYICPPGKQPSDIVGIAIIAIRDTQQVIAFYRDGTYSLGLSNNLGAHKCCMNYTLPRGKSPDAVVGVAAATLKAAWEYTQYLIWYKDGTVSGGDLYDLGNWRSPYQYVLPLGKTTEDIVEMGVAPDTGYVYTWYRDGTVSAGISDHLDRHRACYPYRLPKNLLIISGLATRPVQAWNPI